MDAAGPVVLAAGVAYCDDKRAYGGYCHGPCMPHADVAVPADELAQADEAVTVGAAVPADVERP